MDDTKVRAQKLLEHLTTELHVPKPLHGRAPGWSRVAQVGSFNLADWHSIGTQSAWQLASGRVANGRLRSAVGRRQDAGLLQAAGLRAHQAGATEPVEPIKSRRNPEPGARSTEPGAEVRSLGADGEERHTDSGRQKTCMSQVLLIERTCKLICVKISGYRQTNYKPTRPGAPALWYIVRYRMYACEKFAPRGGPFHCKL